METLTANRPAANSQAPKRQKPFVEPRDRPKANAHVNANPNLSSIKKKPGSAHGAPAPDVSDRQSLRKQPASTGSAISLPTLFLTCGFVTGTVLALASVLDLATEVPFLRASAVFDVGLLFSSVTLLYLSYEARDGARA